VNTRTTCTLGRNGTVSSKQGLLPWVSYTGDLRLFVGAADYEDDEPFGSDIDQATFDGKHLSMNGYDWVWEVIEPSEWLKFLNDGIHYFVPNGRGRGLQ
jgi:hypothetical protein